MSRIADMDRRLARLERQNRILFIVCLTLAAFPFVVGAGQIRIDVDKPIVGQIGKVEVPAGATGVLSQDMRETLKLSNAILPIVKTKLLCLVDSKGKARATLSTDENSNPSLALYDLDGKLSSQWKVDNSGSMIQIFGYQKKPLVRLGVDSHPILEMADNARLFGGSRDTNYFELDSKGGKPKMVLDGAEASSINLRGRQDQEISLGCKIDGDRNVYLNMSKSANSPQVSLSAGAEAGALAFSQPGTKFKAWFNLWSTTGGSIYSRHKESESTHQLFQAHSYQGASPTRSAHLREISPDSP